MMATPDAKMASSCHMMAERLFETRPPTIAVHTCAAPSQPVKSQLVPALKSTARSKCAQWRIDDELDCLALCAVKSAAMQMKSRVPAERGARHSIEQQHQARRKPPDKMPNTTGINNSNMASGG
jgi:hypothetical protein